MWRWQMPDLCVSSVSQGCVRQPQRKRWGAAWVACKTSGDQHLGRRTHLLVSCLEASSLPALPVWPKGPRSCLWLNVQPCLAGSHGQTSFADGPNIRLGRQDEIWVVSVMSQSARSGVIPIGTRSHKAVQRLAAASVCYRRRDLDMTWGHWKAQQLSILVFCCPLITFSVGRPPTSL